MPFSVLMSIYSATGAVELSSCLKSLTEQHLAPDQIVLVRDGPVHPSVEQCIKKYAAYLPFEHLYFPENRGLGYALRDGLEACENEFVARIDSDDISVPHRFTMQDNYLINNPGISVIGCWMKEYYPQIRENSALVHKTPLEPSAVARCARRRNPLNHPTVMFRKSHVHD